MAERNKPSAPKTVKKEKEVLQGTQLAKKSSNPSKPTVKKIKVETLIAIANIFITVIVGVYLAIRNENIQQKLIELQNQIQYATLEIKNNCNTTSICEINVTNLGPSTATNLRISFLLGKVSDSWKNDLSDASSIGIALNNPSLQFDTTNKYSPVPEDNGMSVTNTKLITIKSLPPGGIITAIPFLSTQPYTIDTTLNLKITSDKNLPTKNLYKQVVAFINRNFFITTLTVNVNCDNCSGAIPELKYPLSALREISLKSTPAQNATPLNWEFDVQIRSNNNIAQPIILTTSPSVLGSLPDINTPTDVMSKTELLGEWVFQQPRAPMPSPAGENQVIFAHDDINNTGTCHVKEFKAGETVQGLGLGSFKLWLITGTPEYIKDVETQLQKGAASHAGTDCPYLQ